MPMDMSIFEKLRDVRPTASRFYVHILLADSVEKGIGMELDCAVALTACAGVAMGMHDVYTGRSEAMMDAILRGNAEAAARIIGDGTVMEVDVPGARAAYFLPGRNCSGLFTIAERPIDLTPDLARRFGVEGVRHVSGSTALYIAGNKRYYIYAALFITKDGIGNRLALMVTPLSLLADAGYSIVPIIDPLGNMALVLPVGMVIMSPAGFPLNISMGWDTLVIVPPCDCPEAADEVARVADVLSHSPFLIDFKSILSESVRAFRGERS